jgi:nicotinamide riboside kinase
MEKRTGGSHDQKLIRVVITGPECTGKSTLTLQLARHYNALYIPEYAREYISGLSRPYNYSDVEHIAGIQVRQKDEYSRHAKGLLFLDTYLIITKVWFDLVFQRRPLWIDQELARNEINLFLLCDIDIPWEPDPVRENGGKMREILLQHYRKELEEWGYAYRLVKGYGEQRLQNAIRHVEDFISGDITNGLIIKN